MDKKYYTNERNVQIVIALLKAFGIKRVIASPGTTNMTFIGSIQNDPFFEIWSSVDERSAAYLACGMAAETGEPVVISCTGATASRNYLPGLTEAYYRKLPILAITSHRGESHIGHLHDQQIDRRTIPNDVAVERVTIPMVDSPEDEKYCRIEANKAILALTRRGGGPVHMNMYTRYSPNFSVKELPKISPIFRYTVDDQFPKLPSGRIGISIGSHRTFSEEETEVIDRFCASHNAIVFCDHTSGYNGKYRVNFHLVCAQINYFSNLACPDLMLHIGEVSGCFNPIGKDVWRISPDGELRDTFGRLRKVFEMSELDFFRHYSIDGECENLTSYYDDCQKEYNRILSLIPELPFGNIWIAQHTIPHLPENSELHMGIFNSLRSWSFFQLPTGVSGSCNVGGFGIDGAISTMIGASLVHPDKLFFGVFGDLAFFYDMNVLGNRHVGNNIRIILVNNARGTEFRLKRHPCSIFGEDADKYMAAAGHFGCKSPDVVTGYAKALGFKYLSALTKEEFLSNLQELVSPEVISHQPILMEVFTNTDDESESLETIQTLITDKQALHLRKAGKIAREIIGSKGVESIKSLLGK